MPEDRYRLGLVFQISALNLVAGFAVGAFQPRPQANGDHATLAIMAGPIVSATLLVAVALFAFPSLTPNRRLEFPLNLTLPVVFAMLVRASVILWTSPASAIFQTADPLLPALAWTSVRWLLALAAADCALLSVGAVLNRRR